MLPRITGTIATFVGFFTALGSLDSFTRFFAETHDLAPTPTPLAIPGIFFAPCHPALILVGAILAAVAYWRRHLQPDPSAMLWHLLLILMSAICATFVSIAGAHVITLSGAKWAPWPIQYFGNALWLSALLFLATTREVKPPGE